LLFQHIHAVLGENKLYARKLIKSVINVCSLKRTEWQA